MSKKGLILRFKEIKFDNITGTYFWSNGYAYGTVELVDSDKGKQIKLDELGAFVFGLIDGTRNVRQIIADFVARYGTTKREAELSTVDFLRSLAKRHAISIAVK